jgi:hypothetical protein
MPLSFPDYRLVSAQISWTRRSRPSLLHAEKSNREAERSAIVTPTPMYNKICNLHFMFPLSLSTAWRS